MMLGTRVKFDDRWKGLSESVLGLITLTQKNVSSMYEDVFTLSNHNAKELYRRLNELLIEHVRSIAQILDGKPDEELLTEYLHHWECYSKGAGYVNTVFRHLNNGWVKKNTNLFGYRPQSQNPVCSVIEIALHHWIKGAYNPFQSRLVELVLKEIEQARDESRTASLQAKAFIESLHKISNQDKDRPNVSLYEQDFEKLFLQKTEEYFTRVVALIEIKPPTEFVMEAELMIKTEDMRASALLDGASMMNLQNTLTHLLVDKKEGILGPMGPPLFRKLDEVLQDAGDSGIPAEDLKRLYRLVNRSSSLNSQLLEQVKTEMRDLGLREMHRLPQKIDPVGYVDALLKILRRFQTIISVSFGDSEQYLSQMKIAIKEVVNDNGVHGKKSSEFFAKYCDFLLRGGQKDLHSSSALDNRIKEVATLFTFLDDRDLFQTYYINLTSKRLLFRTSYSDESEHTILLSLKDVFGFGFVSKIHKMFNDINTSESLTRGFLNMNTIKFDFYVNVLTSGCWSVAYQACNGFICSQQEQASSLFTKYYSTLHSTRKLTWLHHLSQSEIRASFTRDVKNFDITVSAEQYAILRLFTTNEKMTMALISEATALPKDRLAIVLKSLLYVKVLRKNPPTHELNPSHLFALNTSVSFKAKTTKLNFAKLLEKSSLKKEDDGQVEKNAIASRKYVVEAAIVRVMKTRKELGHSNLIQEVVEQLQRQFNPPVPLIKKSIEALIEKEYLERVSDNSNNVYRYLA